ncbi:MAG: hypothetical protein SGPRY_006259 [Prymnesium sp.]
MHPLVAARRNKQLEVFGAAHQLVEGYNVDVDVVYLRVSAIEGSGRGCFRGGRLAVSARGSTSLLAPVFAGLRLQESALSDQLGSPSRLKLRADRIKELAADAERLVADIEKHENRLAENRDGGGAALRSKRA